MSESRSCMEDRCAGCRHHVNDLEDRDNCCTAQFPHVEPPTDCARDEITEWVASFYAGDDLDEAVSYLLEWANRRAANIIEHTVEALKWIQNEASDFEGVPEMDRVAIAAHRALRFVGKDRL